MEPDLALGGRGVEQVEGDLLRGLAADGLLLGECVGVVTNLGFICTLLLLRLCLKNQTFFHHLRLHLFNQFGLRLSICLIPQ